MQNQLEIISFENLLDIDQSIKPFALIRGVCFTIQKEFTDSEKYILAINDLRRLRKYHYDVFISMVGSVLATVATTIDKCPVEKQVIVSLVFLKELFSGYTSNNIANSLPYLIRAVLKASLSQNEDIKEESYNCLNFIAHNMFFMTTYETLCYAVIDMDEYSANAFATLQALLFKWEIQTFLDNIYLELDLFTTSIFEIYTKNNAMGIQLLKVIHDKIGKDNFEILRKLNSNIEECFDIIMDKKLKDRIVKIENKEMKEKFLNA